MRSIRKYTQGLDGFQVVREELITSKCLVENPTKIEQLSLRRRQESKIVLHVERTDCAYQCPYCGGVHTHAYKLRDRTVNGVPDAFIPVVIRFAVHRLYCPDCGETWVEKIPFLSKPTSRSTRQLEKTIVALRGDMSIKALSASLGLSWGRVKKVEKDYLAKKYAHIPLKGVKALTIDEICVFHKGPIEWKYMTVVRNAETNDVLFVGDGRDADSLKPFEKRLARWKKNIKYVCMDMSTSYAKWVKDFLGEETDIVYDHFHVIKSMNDKTDKVRRRTMNKQDADLKKIIKGQRRTLTKNHEDLTADEKNHLNEIRATFGELADVYAMKEMLRGIYSFTESAWAAELLLEDWCETARKTEVPELISMARSIEEHKEGILGYWRYGKACNSGAEGFNTKIRWLLKQAFGYRDREYLRLKIYALPDTQTNREL